MSFEPELVPLAGNIPDDYFTGASHITNGDLAYILNRLGVSGSSRSWSFQTNEAVQYAAGFYEFAASDDDFSPAINFGDVGVGVAAHFLVVVGAVPVDAVTVRVTGTSINDDGVQVIGDSEDIVIPLGTSVDAYFETSLKWNGQVTVETVAGTPVTCNYGWSKYHDVNNLDFRVLGLETLWESDSTDSTSDIELIHHKATGWTFNSGAEPDPPPPIAARSIDHAGNVTHKIGAGAWKRANLDTLVRGGDSEGILFRITSGTTGIGTLSFRSLTLEVTLRLAGTTET